MHLLGFVMPRVVFLRFALVVFFAFCQVAGVMCAMPDILLSSDLLVLSEAGVGCPMDDGLMCPPLLASSPDRHAKGGSGLDINTLGCADAEAALVGLPASRVGRSVAVSPPLICQLSACLQVLRI